MLSSILIVISQQVTWESNLLSIKGLHVEIDCDSSCWKKILTKSYMFLYKLMVTTYMHEFCIVLLSLALPVYHVFCGWGYLGLIGTWVCINGQDLQLRAVLHQYKYDGFCWKGPRIFLIYFPSCLALHMVLVGTWKWTVVLLDYPLLV